MLNGILCILRTGATWRDLPERFGAWKTVYHYFRLWRDSGTFERILQALQIRLDRDGQIDWDLWCIDGSSVRAYRASAGASKKVSISTLTSRQTTLWAAQKADSAANSTWLLTAEEYHWPLKRLLAKHMSPHKSKRFSIASVFLSRLVVRVNVQSVWRATRLTALVVFGTGLMLMAFEL